MKRLLETQEESKKRLRNNVPIKCASGPIYSIPEQGKFGSCGIIAAVSLVLEAHCLNEYLKKANPDAHHALNNVRTALDTERGSIEGQVCPYLPPSIWRDYDESRSWAYNKEGPGKTTTMLSQKTTRQIFSDVQSKKSFLRQADPGHFLKSLFGVGNAHYDFFVLEKMVGRNMQRRSLAVVNALKETLNEFKKAFRLRQPKGLFHNFPGSVDVPVVIEVFLDLSEEMPLGQNSYNESSEPIPLVSENLINFFVLIFSLFSDDQFYILPQFIMTGRKNVEGGEHGYHALPCSLDKSRETLNICSWGVCSEFIDELSSIQREKAWHFLDKIEGYHLMGIIFVLVPESWHGSTWDWGK